MIQTRIRSFAIGTAMAAMALLLTGCKTADDNVVEQMAAAQHKQMAGAGATPAKNQGDMSATLNAAGKAGSAKTGQ